ncbi:DUF4326 domain-containing protein [Mycolicibacterium llatzerense]|uniref:DUF4326 domain-containing protein n=1 Tax=Mycolicibacterium llatzerense TaxID=280871 RepID=UPI0021B664CF|nr:DUF4326 domain-containing protein [Mycolicibacterium llatzerense]
MTTALTGHWAPMNTDIGPQPRMHRPDHPAASGAVSVDSGTDFANPFEADARNDEQRRAALLQYAVWLAAQPSQIGATRQLGGHDLSCTCALGDSTCHRNVLLDIANPPRDAFAAEGRAMGLTLRRPWASLLLVPETLGGKTIENRTWSTDYRGPVLIYGGTRIDNAGVAAARRAGLDTDWHVDQQGWLGAAMLVDVHRSRGCCRPWGQPHVRDDVPVYHWVFTHPQRLASRTWGRGFHGLRPTSWSVLIRRRLLNTTTTQKGAHR